MNKPKAKANVKLIALIFTAILLGSILGYIWSGYANPVSPTVYLDDLPASAYYVLHDDGVNAWATRYDGFIAYESTTHINVLNWAVQNLPTAGGIICLQPPFSASGELIINKSKTSIISHYFPTRYSTSSNVYIERVKIDASANEVDYIYLEGFFTYQVWYYVTGSYGISGVTLERVKVSAENNVNHKGIVWDVPSTGGGSPWIDGLQYLQCYFHQSSVYAGYGMFTVLKGGLGLITMDGCMYSQASGITCSFIYVTDSGASYNNILTAVDITDLKVVGSGTMTFLDYRGNQKVAYTGMFGINVKGGYWECAGSVTVVNIEACTQAIATTIIFDGVTFDPYSGTTTTLVDFANVNWLSSWKSKVSFVNCQKINTGTLSFGSWTANTNLHFVFDIFHYPTENSGISEASNGDYIAHGLVAIPTNVQLSIEETDANYALQLQSKNATHIQVYLYDLTAGAAETTDKTVHWHVWYTSNP